jgi:hypothetical protein
MDRAPQTGRQKCAIAEEMTSCQTVGGGAELMCRLREGCYIDGSRWRLGRDAS